MRRSEVSGLQWEDVDFISGAINIRHSFTKSDGLRDCTKTKAGTRRVPMVPMVRESLSEIWEASGRPSTGFVLLTDGGRPLRTMKIAGLVDKRGKSLFHPHALRHAAAALLIEQGVQPLEVAKLIGHADVSTTLRTYAYLFDDNSKATAALSQISTQLAPRAEVEPIRRPMTRQEIDRAARERRKALKALPAPRPECDADATEAGKSLN